MSSAAVPTLDPDVTYELCPDCGVLRGRFDFLRRAWAWLRRDAHGFCLTCFDEGLVPHGCAEED